MRNVASFSTPGSYLAHLQAVYARSYPTGSVDEAFATITRNQVAEAQLPASILSQFEGLRLALSEMTREIHAAMDRDMAQRVAADIAIGVLPSGEAEAFISRSSDGKYAVLFSAGLMLLLHKYLKLVRGFVTPSEVVYCNRKPASDLTKEDLGRYVEELIAIHHEHEVPYGPMVKLSDRAMSEHSFVLHSAELFIVCHELGHYFNGDLDDQDAYAMGAPGSDGRRYIENQDHEIEHLADIAGFRLYLACLQKQGASPGSLEVLKPLLATFNLLYALGGGASSTHPHPYDRVVRIVEYHYGEETAVSMAAALSDPSLLPLVFERSK
jgi:hypothetical protein